MPIFTPLLIYYCALKKGIAFEMIPEEHIFELNIAIYSALFLVIAKIIEFGVKKYKGMYSTVSVIAARNEERFNNQDLSLNFNSNFVKVYIQIKLNGNPKQLKDKEISIFFPPQVSAQLTRRSREYCSVNNNQCMTINLSKVFNYNKTDNIYGDGATFDIDIEKLDEVVESSAEISLTKGKKMTNLNKNKIYFEK